MRGAARGEDLRAPRGLRGRNSIFLENLYVPCPAISGVRLRFRLGDIFSPYPRLDVDATGAGHQEEPR